MLKHFTATVFLFTKEKPSRVLLLHHKKFDKWMPPGGHVESNENHFEAAIRETLEETGIDVANLLGEPIRVDDRAIALPLPKLFLEEFVDLPTQPKHYHLDFIYTVFVSKQEIKLHARESHSAKWFYREELDGLKTFENIIKIVDLVLFEKKLG